MYVCMYVRMYVCMHVCIYAYVCIYIYIYIHIQIHARRGARRASILRFRYLLPRKCVCAVFSCLAILRIEGCLNSILQQYSWNPLTAKVAEGRTAKAKVAKRSPGNSGSSPEPCFSSRGELPPYRGSPGTRRPVLLGSADSCDTNRACGE